MIQDKIIDHKIDEIFDSSYFEIKEVAKWILCTSITEKLGKPVNLKSPFKIIINFKCIEADKYVFKLRDSRIH